MRHSLHWILVDHFLEVAAEGVEHVGVGETELSVAHTLSVAHREPFGMGVEVAFVRDKVFESVDKHTPIAIEVGTIVQPVPVGVELRVVRVEV